MVVLVLVPKISDSAMSAGVKSVRELCDVALLQAISLRIVATSAVRDAVNGSKFNKQIELATGLNVKFSQGNKKRTPTSRTVVRPQLKK